MVTHPLHHPLKQTFCGGNQSEGGRAFGMCRNSCSGEGATPLVAGTAATSYTDTNLADGITHYYALVAHGYNGNSQASNEASAIPYGDPVVTVTAGDVEALR